MTRGLAIVLAVAACAGCRGVDAERRAAAPAKPRAPLDLELAAVELGAGRWAVTLEATARVPLEELALEIRGARAVAAGAVEAGGRRRLVAEVGDGEAIGLARARTARGDVGRAVSLILGPAPEAKRAAPVVVTPFGPVAESGP